MSSSLKFASSFAPYTPPPDDPQHPSHNSATNGRAAGKQPVRPWFPAHESSQNAVDTSYQSGGIPTFNASQAGGAAVEEAAESGQSRWETTYGLRVDVLAAIAYLLGPISALALLIAETQNDYIRFHAYQSALLTTPLLAIRIVASLLHFWAWLRTLLTLLLVVPALYMCFRAYIDAARHGLSYFHLPIIGPIAERWVQEE